MKLFLLLLAVAYANAAAGRMNTVTMKLFLLLLAVAYANACCGGKLFFFKKHCRWEALPQSLPNFGKTFVHSWPCPFQQYPVESFAYKSSELRLMPLLKILDKSELRLMSLLKILDRSELRLMPLLKILDKSELRLMPL
ncbi:Hypp4932 [Branchiostoma lanceolatum]|uniref:Hypp4932 protein n=1 Tax=Branchiostoma lanceolatum TaxID=7740 RepID=A0A8K0AE36_BRALA|nr:Hypp4932 [Branchiostoma lanceolatum]